MSTRKSPTRPAAAVLMFALIAAATPSAIHAATAIDLVSIGGGNTGSFTVGFEFTLSQTITVTHLGRYDFGGAGFGQAADAAIWNLAQVVQVGGTVPQTTSGGGFIEADAPSTGVMFRPVMPTTLTPGTYVIGIQSGTEAFATQPSGVVTASGITWTRARAENGAALAFPDDIQHTTATAYYGPNFKFASGPRIDVASYVYDGVGAGAAPTTWVDSGGELTNGILPASTAFADTQWVGFQDILPDDGTSHPQITFNLGGFHILDELVITYLHSTSQAGGTITAPEDVRISTSLDGVSFGTPVIVSSAFNSAAGDEIRSAFIDLSGMTGQYVRLDFRNTSQWTFLGEVTFTGVVPAPAALPAGLGLLTIVSLRRRRRAA